MSNYINQNFGTPFVPGLNQPLTPQYTPAISLARSIINMNGIQAQFDFIQRGFNSPVEIQAQLGGIYNITQNGPLPFHIHRQAIIPNDRSCLSALGHFDPNNVNPLGEKSATYFCQKNDFRTCEVGDLSGKFFPLPLVPNSRYVFVDPTILDVQQLKYLSMVIHNPDKSRLACGNFFP